jgi:hypothetical protein
LFFKEPFKWFFNPEEPLGFHIEDKTEELFWFFKEPFKGFFNHEEPLGFHIEDKTEEPFLVL